MKLSQLNILLLIIFVILLFGYFFKSQYLNLMKNTSKQISAPRYCKVCS